MKNVNVLCKMAIAIKDVPIINISTGYNFNGVCCLAGSCRELGIISPELSNILVKGDEGSIFFGINLGEWHEVIFLTNHSTHNYNNIIYKGIDYYDKLVTLLREHNCLQFLRRIENNLQ